MVKTIDLTPSFPLTSYEEETFFEEVPSSFSDFFGEQPTNTPIIVRHNRIESANFVTGSTGWQLTDTSGEINFALSVASLDIPDTTTANSFHVESDGDTFWGANVATGFAAAPASISKAGVGKFTNIVITGGSMDGVPISGIPNNSTTDISLLDLSHDLVFSVTDANTIAWSSGTITLSNGRTFSIDAGNTGNMSAFTYIYLDPGTSATVLQTTTTAATAIGADKRIIGSAEDQTTTASFIPFGPGKPLIDGDNIGAVSIKAAAIGALAVTTAKINTLAVTDAKINDLAVSKLTAGTITSKDIVLATAGGGDVAIRSGKTDFVTSTSGFILGVDDSDSDLPKFYIGDPDSFFFFDGTFINFSGTINDIERSFGDASDGDVTISSNTTLAANKQYESLIIDSGFTLTTAGYTVKVRGSVTINGSLVYNGNNGANGSGGQNPGAGGAALAGNTVDGGEDGKSGGNGGVAGASTGAVGTAGDAVNPSVGVSGNAGGASGSGFASAVAGGIAGVATGENTQFINNDPPVNLTAGSEDTLVTQFEGATSGVSLSESAGSGGGGGGSCTNGGDSQGGAGGGSGSTGGNLVLLARFITVAASGTISVLGGTGGNGGDGGGADNGDGGGGGGGGTGGNLFLAYKTLTNSGSISVVDGAGGSGGSGNGTGGSGVGGASGADGKLFKIKI